MNRKVIARLLGLLFMGPFVMGLPFALVVWATSPDADASVGFVLSAAILVALIVVVSLVGRYRRRLVVVAEEYVPSGGLDGRLVSVSGRTGVAQILVWFKYHTDADDVVFLEALTDADGRFSFALPTDPVLTSWLGADLLGVEPLDLEAGSATMEPGDVVLLVHDILPSHIRFA